MSEKPIYLGEWFQGDTLNDLVVPAEQQNSDGTRSQLDLTNATTATLQLRSADSATAIDVGGTVQGDGSDGNPWAVKFQNLTGSWSGPPAGVNSEMFTAYVFLIFTDPNTGAELRGGWLRPNFTLSFRVAPSVTPSVTP